MDVHEMVNGKVHLLASDLKKARCPVAPPAITTYRCLSHFQYPPHHCCILVSIFHYCGEYTSVTSHTWKAASSVGDSQDPGPGPGPEPHNVGRLFVTRPRLSPGKSTGA